MGWFAYTFGMFGLGRLWDTTTATVGGFREESSSFAESTFKWFMIIGAIIGLFTGGIGGLVLGLAGGAAASIVGGLALGTVNGLWQGGSTLVAGSDEERAASAREVAAADTNVSPSPTPNNGKTAAVARG